LGGGEGRPRAVHVGGGGRASIVLIVIVLDPHELSPCQPVELADTLSYDVDILVVGVDFILAPLGRVNIQASDHQALPPQSGVGGCIKKILIEGILGQAVSERRCRGQRTPSKIVIYRQDRRIDLLLGERG
jgi:hypothetical protein